jgi:hypothetical protein
MKTNFLEKNRVVHACPVAELSANDELWDGAGATILNSDVMSLKNADGAVFIVATSANAGNGTSSVRICACDDNGAPPTTTVAVSFRYMTITAPDTIFATGEATSYLTSTAGDMVYIFEVDAAKVAEQGYEFIYFNADEVAGAGTEGHVVSFLTGLRYKEDDIGAQVG